MSIKKLAIKATIWTIIGYGAGQILRFGSNLILTRLIAPEAFGLMSLVYTFLVGLNLFSDVGLGPNIIQSKRGDDPVFLNTAWTVQIVRSMIICVCCLIIAYPVSLIYQEPRLVPLISAIAFSTAISGFNSTALFSLNRRLATQKIILFDLGNQIVSISAMIIYAWVYRNVWALVVGGVASAIFQLIITHQLNPVKRNRLAWNKEALKEIFSFGRWIFFSTAVTFLGTQSDRLVLSKLLSFELFGVYGVAYALAYIPTSIIGTLSGRVFLPVAAKLAELPRQTFRQQILKTRKAILAIAAVCLTFLVSFGDIVILHLYDQRYSQAAWMMPLLALGIWPHLLYQTLNQCLMAIGKPKYEAFGQLYKAIMMCLGMPLAFYFFKIIGPIVVIALNDLPLYVAIAYGLWREGLNSLKQDVIMTIFFILLLTIVLSIRYVAGLGLPISNYQLLMHN